MKNKFLLTLLVVSSTLIFSKCASEDDPNDFLDAADLYNVSYGNDPQQKIDIYLPQGRDETTKVIVLLHGGSWVAGSKEDLNYLIPTIKTQFPNHAIVNINYRLATAQSPAFPKQIDDIEQVLEHLEFGGYSISDDYAFIGFSAGAHLSMLYGYTYNGSGDVKAIVNVVGPADLTDPAYLDHPQYEEAALHLTGSTNPSPALIELVNPIAHISPDSPPTLMFYGGQDPLIPASQGPRLRDALDNFGIYNELNFYPDGGHANWNAQIMMEVYSKIAIFLQDHF